MLENSSVALPRLSVCIPTYDRLHYLKEAVESAQGQTASDIEILIGDDGDSNLLRTWAEAKARDDPRVKYVKNATRLGLAGNWDACAGRASGEYLCFIGDDDRLLPTFAERLLAEGAGADVIFCDQHLIDALGRRLDVETQSMHEHYRRNELQGGRLADAERWVWRNSVPMSAALVRREAAVRLGFKHDLNTPEIELFARLAHESGTFHFVPAFLAEYRTHAGSLTAMGLCHESLVKYLVPIEVSPEAEPDKRALLRRVTVAGVHRLLLAGDARGAAELCRSRYYPRGLASARALVQRCFAQLPYPGPRLYPPLFRLAKSLLRHS
jgi:glycosyltransferase involved in cell wall biosynthesis